MKEVNFQSISAKSLLSKKGVCIAPKEEYGSEACRGDMSSKAYVGVDEAGRRYGKNSVFVAWIACESNRRDGVAHYHDKN